MMAINFINIMTYIHNLGKVMQYLFLTFFLIVFFGIIIFSIVSNKRQTNKNSPTRRVSKDVPFHEKLSAVIIVVSLPLGVISFIVFENFMLGIICISLFVLTIFLFIIFSAITKISVKKNLYGHSTVIYFTPKEFEARLEEGTLDLTDCKVKYPFGYKPPKLVNYNNNIEDDPFSNYNEDDIFSKYD